MSPPAPEATSSSSLTAKLIKFKTWIVGVGSVIGALAVIWTAVAFAVEPHVEGVLVRIMDQKGYAKQDTVQRLNSQVVINGAVAKDVKERSIRMEGDLSNLKEQLKSQSDTLRELLIELRSQRRQ